VRLRLPLGLFSAIQLALSRAKLVSCRDIIGMKFKNITTKGILLHILVSVENHFSKRESAAQFTAARLRGRNTAAVKASQLHQTPSIKRRHLKKPADAVSRNGKAKPLSIQVDHINGVNDDYRLENLRILCANSHGLTPTHGRRASADLHGCGA